jgi:hypothetical protein
LYCLNPFRPSCHFTFHATVLTTNTTQTSMPSVEFEPTIPVSERPKIHALDRTATGIGIRSPDRPARSELLYLLSYTGPEKKVPNCNWNIHFTRIVKRGAVFIIKVQLCCLKYWYMKTQKQNGKSFCYQRIQ